MSSACEAFDRFDAQDLLNRVVGDQRRVVASGAILMVVREGNGEGRARGRGMERRLVRTIEHGLSSEHPSANIECGVGSSLPTPTGAYIPDGAHHCEGSRDNLLG